MVADSSPEFRHRFKQGAVPFIGRCTKSLPEDLKMTASTREGMIMAIEHRSYPLLGVQFHPESILTEHGYTLIRNFLVMAGLEVPDRIPE